MVPLTLQCVDKEPFAELRTGYFAEGLRGQQGFIFIMVFFLLYHVFEKPAWKFSFLDRSLIIKKILVSSEKIPQKSLEGNNE